MSETATMPAPASNRDLAATIGKKTNCGIVASGVQIGTRLISVPVVIHYLGLGGYGIWSIIMVTAAYMRFGSAGIKSAFQKYVAEATGNGDYETANKLLSTGCVGVLAISVVALVPVACFSRQLARVAGVPDAFLRSAAGAISMLAEIMMVANWGAVYE